MSRGSGHFQIGQDPGKDVGEGEQPSMCGIIWLQHQRHTKLFFSSSSLPPPCASIKGRNLYNTYHTLSELPPFSSNPRPSKGISDEGKMRADALSGIGAQERFCSKIF